MAGRPTSDAALPVETVPARYCPRKLKPGQVKRYMTVGPLVGYMVACPSCGFIEMHMHERADFVEVDGKLTSAGKPFRCMVCLRKITVDAGVISACHPPTEAVP